MQPGESFASSMIWLDVSIWSTRCPVKAFFGQQNLAFICSSPSSLVQSLLIAKFLVANLFGINFRKFCGVWHSWSVSVVKCHLSVSFSLLSFSAQKQLISKKRCSPKLRRIFRPKSEIQTVFQPKTSWSKKKKIWEGFFGQNWKFKRFFCAKTGDLQKKRSSPKLRRIFRPKSEIRMGFQAESRHLLHNFGT